MTDIINSEDEKLDEDVEELLALALEPEAENSGDVNVDQTVKAHPTLWLIKFAL